MYIRLPGAKLAKSAAILAQAYPTKLQGARAMDWCVDALLFAGLHLHILLQEGEKHFFDEEAASRSRCRGRNCSPNGKRAAVLDPWRNCKEK